MLHKVTTVNQVDPEVMTIEIDVVDTHSATVECTHTITLPFKIIPPQLCYQIASMLAGVNGYLRRDDVSK